MRIRTIGFISTAAFLAAPAALAIKSLVHVKNVGLGDAVVSSPHLTDNVGFNAGTRLQPVYAQGSDGSGFPTGAFYDTKLQEKCNYTSGLDDAGSIYCIGPSYHATVTTTQEDLPPPINNCAYSGGYFSDSACTQVVAYASAGETVDCAYSYAADGITTMEMTIGACLEGPDSKCASVGGSFNIYYINTSVMPGSPNYCNSVAAVGYDIYPVTGPWNDPTVTTVTWPPLDNYVKVTRQVDLGSDGHPRLGY